MRKDLPVIADEILRKYPKECAAGSAGGKEKQKPDPSMLASVQILAGVHASFFAASSTMKFEANDLIDAQHAAIALPYCSALFVEKPLAHRLTTKPLDYGVVYGKPVFSDPDEFLVWLNRL